MSSYQDIKNINIDKLHTIESLEKNWNGNKAHRFSKELITKVKEIVYFLDKQPEIFPVADGKIQIEYDGNNDSYLEFVIDLSDKCSFFQVDQNGKELTGSIHSNFKDINRKVQEFYGQ